MPGRAWAHCRRAGRAGFGGAWIFVPDGNYNGAPEGVYSCKERSMKRWGVVWCAAAVCLFASGQAQASFRVVKASWGQCIIWDYGPGKPPAPVTVMSKPKQTFAAALKSHGRLVKKKQCAF
jgi:hypothetical protein